MTGSMVFAVGYFAFDVHAAEQKILGKHIFDVAVYLGNGVGVDVLHSFFPIFPRIPLIKAGESSPPNFFASSTASLMATPTGTSSSNSIS